MYPDVTLVRWDNELIKVPMRDILVCVVYKIWVFELDNYFLNYILSVCNVSLGISQFVIVRV